MGLCAIGSFGVLLWAQAGAEGSSGALCRLQLQKWAGQNSGRKSQMSNSTMQCSSCLELMRKLEERNSGITV